MATSNLIRSFSPLIRLIGYVLGTWSKKKERQDMRKLIGNTIVGLILLFLTNLFLADDIPINILTVVICAILGVAGWAIVLILHLLGVAF